MGRFGKQRKKKEKIFLMYGTVHIDVFSSFVYTEKKRKKSVGGCDIFRVVSMDFSSA